MKIGIITIHFPYNYGAMLQAYALKKYLKDLGYQAEVIDYRPYFIDRDYRFYWRNIIWHKRKFMKDIMRINKIDRKGFEKFLNREILEEKKNRFNINKNWNDYDFLITGSDQVWNPVITNKDMTYFLNFAKDCKSKKLSYAASIAIDTIDDDWKMVMQNELMKYSKISVREDNVIGFLNNVLKLGVTQVLDPVFLLHKNEWDKMSEKPICLTGKEKFILLYRLQSNLDLDNRVLHYKLNEKNDLKIISIHPFRRKDSIADIVLNEIGPKEFLWLVNNAKCVFTNSFHGTAFSIIFNKQFVTINHSNTGARMESLLNILHIKEDSNGIRKSDNQRELMLEKRKEESMNWLKDAIQKN